MLLNPFHIPNPINCNTNHIYHRNLCIGLQTVEEELKHVDRHRARVEAAVSYAETHLAAEREARIVAEREVKRLT